MTRAALTSPAEHGGDEPPLDYGSRTRPDPLEANLSEPSTADLSIVVSNRGFVEVRCSSIVVDLPVGGRPRDLLATGTGIEASVTTPGWTKAGETVGPGQARFEFQPVSGEAVIAADPVSFTFNDISVNSAVGVAYPRITETSAIGQDPLLPRERFIRLPKFPTGVSDRPTAGTNLRVYAGERPADDQPPAVRVPHGSKTTVTWDAAPNVVRHLHYQDQATGTEIGPGQTSVVCGPLHRETTFTLQTVSQAGGEPITRYDSYTVQMDVPDYPSVTLPNGSLSDVSSSGLRITSPVAVGETLTLKEPFTFRDSASVHGRPLDAPLVEAGTTRFSGRLEVSGAFTAASLTASKVTTTSGLTATRRVNVLKATYTSLAASGSQTFTTDGLLLANADDNEHLELWVTTPTYSFKTWTCDRVGTLIAPVRAGETVSWGVNGPGGGYTFRWYPFGT